MLIWNPSKLTTKGKGLLAKPRRADAQSSITKAQTGSGQYSSGEATDTRASLKAPVQTPLNPQQRDPERKYTRSKGSDHK